MDTALLHRARAHLKDSAWFHWLKAKDLREESGTEWCVTAEHWFADQELKRVYPEKAAKMLDMAPQTDEVKVLRRWALLEYGLAPEAITFLAGLSESPDTLAAPSSGFQCGSIRFGLTCGGVRRVPDWWPLCPIWCGPRFSVYLAQHGEVVFIRTSDLMPDDRAVQGAPGMKFEPIHRPSRADPVSCPSECAAWRAFAGRDGKRFGIHICEDFGRELLDDRRQPSKPDAGLGRWRDVTTGSEVEPSPPPAEVRHHVQPLEKDDGAHLCISPGLVWAHPVWRNARCDPAGERNDSSRQWKSSAIGTVLMCRPDRMFWSGSQPLCAVTYFRAKTIR